MIGKESLVGWLLASRLLKCKKMSHAKERKKKRVFNTEARRKQRVNFKPYPVNHVRLVEKIFSREAAKDGGWNSLGVLVFNMLKDFFT